MKTYDFSEICVLIIEDNTFMRQLLRKMVQGFGVRQVLEASDGSDGLGVMSREQVDVVVTDWLMDPLDGCDLIRTVRTAPDSPNAQVPIIMITGHTEPWRVRFARDAGATEILAKPVSGQTLMQRMVHVIEKPRKTIETFAYTGPDRRRRRSQEYTGEERRGRNNPATAQSAPAAPQEGGGESEGGMSNEDVDALFANANS